MTLLPLLITGCFLALPLLGLGEGKEAGGAGALIGLGVGVAAAGLAAYVLRKTWEIDEETLSSVARALFDRLLGFWIILVLLAAGIMTTVLTDFIVEQMAG